MSATTIQQMADRVAQLMEERLRVKGRTLSDKLERGGQMLPRVVRAEARSLATFAEMAQNPKLLLQIDETRVAAAYDVCVRHLGGINAWGRSRGILRGFVTSLLGNLLLLAALITAILAWRGYL